MSTWTEIARATKPASTYGIDSDNLDRLLLERIARQDRTAMQQLFERHYARISGFFRGLALDLRGDRSTYRLYIPNRVGHRSELSSRFTRVHLASRAR
jgi:hypothetical protein